MDIGARKKLERKEAKCKTGLDRVQGNWELELETRREDEITTCYYLCIYRRLKPWSLRQLGTRHGPDGPIPCYV